MTATLESKRDVFRSLVTTSTYQWPVYDTTPLYDRSSLGALEEDVRTVARVWFEHDAHESVERFVTDLPLVYFEFVSYDRYTGSTQYDIVLLVRVFLLKELHGWEHETALIEHLQQRSSLCNRLNLESIPDQSTLWRSWHQRFTTDLRETVKTAAETILLKADRVGVSVPREPPDTYSNNFCEEAAVDERSILNCAERITNQVTRIVYPNFSLDRGSGYEIHENAFWDLQTYLGLRENLAANEGARSFTLESRRD